MCGVCVFKAYCSMVGVVQVSGGELLRWEPPKTLGLHPINSESNSLTNRLGKVLISA